MTWTQPDVVTLLESRSFVFLIYVLKMLDLEDDTVEASSTAVYTAVESSVDSCRFDSCRQAHDASLELP